MKKNEAKQMFKEVLENKKNPKIKLLGDSITHGVGGSGWQQNGNVIVEGWAESPESFCWASLFRDYMRDKYGARVFNKACTGTTVEFIINNFSALVDSDDDLVICTIGTNNRHQYFSQGEKMSKDEISHNFYENIKKLYGMISDAKIPVIFMANIPASAENEKDGTDYWRIIHMCDINDAYKKLAEKCAAPVVSLYDAMSEYCERQSVTLDSLLCDGLHPNDEGYRVMFKLIVEALAL